MITWMQKHKNYLVVTIWVSVIAFVGAGFVGWGAYSFSNKGSVIAEVGDREVKVSEFQDEYSKIYSFYANMFGNNFNKEMAQKLQLEEVAIKNLIDSTLILNLANEFGIIVLDSEVSEKIVSIESFQENGVFSKERYIGALQRVNLKPKDFEASIKKELLITKVRDIFDINSTNLELETINSAFYMQDRVSIDTISSDSLELNISESDIKDYWEKNRENYKTDTIYEVKVINLTLNDVNLSKNKIEEYYNLNKIEFKDEDGKILSFEDAKAQVEREAKLKQAKKEALKKYLELKKDKIEVETIKVSENSSDFSPNVLVKLRDLKPNDTLKPTEVEDGFLVLKLVNKISPKAMEYEDAKEFAKLDLTKSKKVKLLEEEAKSKLKEFKGQDLGFISRDDISKFELDEEESSKVIERIFGSKEQKGYLILNEKAILFEISNQKLPKEGDMENLDFINQNLLNIKDNLVNSKILDILKSKYEIKLYYKNDKGN